MDMSNQYQNYRATSISTFTPEELLIFLYNELSLYIHQAILKIKKNNLPDAHNSIIKAENIIQYLMDILDLNYPIADELLKLYSYMYKQLIQANIRKDESVLKEILSFVTELKDTWQQAQQKNRK
jgi:flagellar protein FliS